MGNCTNLEYRYYNGVWSSWNTSLYGGYAGCSKYVTWLYFKTPVVSGNYTNTSLSITIPWVRQSWAAKKGTLFIKLHEWSEDADDSSSIGTIPSSSNCDAKADWSSTDLQVHTSTFTVTQSLKANTGYYIIIGNDTNFLEIGYSSKYTSEYSINFNYTSYTNVTANTPTITDNRNNTFTVHASAGNEGTNNKINSTTLYYRIGDSGSYTKHSSLTKSGSITCAASASSQKIYAYTLVDGTYNDAQSTTAAATVKNYQAPSTPGKPALASSSFKNGRLTIKQNWTYSWTAASATNTSSPISGYRIRLYKNGWSIPIKDASGNTLSVDGGEGKAWSVYYDTESTSTSITIDPIKHGIVPGDQVYLGIYAYSKNGSNEQLWSDYVTSDTTTVQNAGVVNVKTASGWVEGQVWVKTAAGWVEAETVNVKTADGWVESQ